MISTAHGALRAAILILIVGGTTMAQAQGTTEDWKVREEAAKARKGALDAEAAAAEAEVTRLIALKKLSDAQAPADPAKTATADAVAAAKAAKDVADAKKAQADSELAAFKAKIGEVPSSGIQGSVAIGDKAGSMETALLAARATATASRDIAKAVKTKVGANATVVIFPAGESPDLKGLREFRAVSELLKAEIIVSMRNVSAASNDNDNELPIAAAGVAIDAVTKLLGFFRSDFNVGGSELTADQGALAEAVSGQLRSPASGTNIPIVYIFSLYYKYDPASDAEFLNKELKPLQQLHSKAEEAQRTGESRVASLNADAAKLTADSDKKKKAKLIEKAGRLQLTIDRLKKVIGLYDAMIDRLAGEGKMEALVRQFEISQRLAGKDTFVLTAKMHKVGGSHYVEKNLWTTFGAMPFKVMGGVIVSYSLFESQTSQLLASELMPIHGGFETANSVGKRIAQPLP